VTVPDVQQACAPHTATLREVMLVIDQHASSLSVLVDDRARVVGVVTDGDVRRALLAGAAIDDPALPHATRNPQVVQEGSPRAHVLDLMRALRISAVPEVDAESRIVRLHTLSDIVGAERLPNLALVMAGGPGSRLGRLTRETPKPLMTVGGRPILDWIVLGLVGDGIREVYVSVNHLADRIEEHLGDGSRLGCTVHYLREEPDNPLGTAGSLRLLRDERPDLADPVVVMNGDLMVEYDARALLAYHASHGAAVTMGVRSYQHEVPFGVVERGPDGHVRAIAEKPTLTLEINAAVYAVQPEVIDLLPEGTASTMPWLVEQCLARDLTVAAWAISEDWIDVGTPADLARAKGQL
jgi:dTDP-glucose pyrophosphorylase